MSLLSSATKTMWRRRLTHIWEMSQIGLVIENLQIASKLRACAKLIVTIVFQILMSPINLFLLTCVTVRRYGVGYSFFVTCMICLLLSMPLSIFALAYHAESGQAEASTAKIRNRAKRSECIKLELNKIIDMKIKQKQPPITNSEVEFVTDNCDAIDKLQKQKNSLENP